MKEKGVIAIIESLDTKAVETAFLCERARDTGFDTLVIDISCKNLSSSGSDFSPLNVLAETGMTQERFEALTKPERIHEMTKALCALLPRLYAEGRFDGVLSAGGAQNSSMAAAAMKTLPFGVPKALASTLACGVRTMEQFVGEKDIVVFPTVSDVSGINAITTNLFCSMTGAIGGMIDERKRMEERAAKEGAAHERRLIAATMLGETSAGCEAALRILREKTDAESVVFHANGVGGRCMEALIREGRIDAVLEFCLHEITCELLGGYCAGAVNRLSAAVESGVPMVVVPGGLDMIDYYTGEGALPLPDTFAKRKSVRHNDQIYHSKLFAEEGVLAAETVAQRLNKATAPVTLVLPTKGLCETTSPGAVCYDEEVDLAMADAFRRTLLPHVQLAEVDGAVNDPAVAACAAEELLLLL